MSLRINWSQTDIRPFLQQGVDEGEALVEFDNVSDAERFRLACYKVRTRTSIGHGFSLVLTTGPSNKPAILMRPTPTFELKRKQPEPA